MISSGSLLLGGPFGHGQGEQQHALQAEFAILGGVPLGQGVRAAAFAAGTHGQSGNAAARGECWRPWSPGEDRCAGRDGDRRRAAFRAAGIGGQLGGRAVADLFELRRSDAPCRLAEVDFAASVGVLDGIFDGAMQRDFEASQLGRRWWSGNRWRPSRFRGWS